MRVFVPIAVLANIILVTGPSGNHAFLETPGKGNGISDYNIDNCIDDYGEAFQAGERFQNDCNECRCQDGESAACVHRLTKDLCIKLPKEPKKPAKVAEPCMQPKVVGLCFAAFPRWFYDKDTQTCKEFIYGGCGGNSNNFGSFAECSKKCSLKEPKKPAKVAGICLQPRVVGVCRAAFPRWFYDQETQTCKRFFYGGCGGNMNNFGSLAECSKKCNLEEPKKTETVAGRCQQPKVVGPCKKRLPRWFYDTETQTCKRFYYGGCGGNKNKFRHFMKCSLTCNP